MRLVWIAAILLGAGSAGAGAETVRVGSKRFTESVILGEIAVNAALAEGLEAHHDRELGGTQLLWKALLRGDLDVYPDYTGTIAQDTLAGQKITTFAELEAALAKHGIGVTSPLGFNNTYALGVRRAVATELGLATISDLAKHPELRFGFSHEFIDRADGWQSVKARYRLPQTDVKGIEHELSYPAISAGDIAVTDLYATDAEIAYYDLVTLEDDLRHFPSYDALYLYRLDLKSRHPGFVERLAGLAGQIPADAMIKMNARAKIDKLSESAVAAAFTSPRWGATSAVRPDPSDDAALWSSLWQHTREHLWLVGMSLLAAIVVALPLGIVAARLPAFGQVILGVSGVFQTIPSLALLVFLIPTLGIGSPPAMAALFVYSLLPIVRNTCIGLRDIAAPLRESATAIGLPSGARLRLIELPLALRTILAGIKTSAVINVGTATLGALVGAGGFGQPILIGIRRDDFGLILQGAIPAAVLALAMQGLFELAERRLVSQGLRVETKGLA